MKRMLFMFLACLALAGCGLGETAVSAAAGASSQAEQAKEALKTEARVKQQLDAAAALDAEHRQAAEASAQ
jgi:Na+-transporting methylmalonyl-CoA/oxaloacetate decarboxylase gamma subunit